MEGTATGSADSFVMPKRRLVLGSIPDDFAANVDLAFGPWCFAGREAQYPGWTELVFVGATDDPDALECAANDATAITEHLLPHLAAAANERWGRTYSAGYWRFIHISWLYRLIELAWNRWLHAEAFVAVHRTESLVAELAPERVDWSFRDLADWDDRALRDADYDWWLSSLILRRLAPTNWRLQERPLQPRPAAPVRTQPRPAPRRLIARLLPRLAFNNVAGATPVEKLLFSAYLNLLPRRKAPPQDFGEWHLPPHIPAAFMEVVRQLIAMTRPASIDKGFEGWEGATKKMRFRPGRLYVGATTWTSERDLYMAAHAVEAGEKIVPVQYGCNYGMSRVFSFPARLHYTQWAFITWGWTAQQSYEGRFVPLPSPELSKLSRHHEENPELIFVGTVMYLILVRMMSIPRARQVVRYRQEKMAFLRALDDIPRRALAYRPYLATRSDLEDLPAVRRVIPEVKVVEGPLHPRILKSRLVVLDNPGTTLNIAMAANVPVIGFWDRAAWPECRQLKPLYDRMADLGILHSNGISAAHFANRIWKDVQGWWQSTDIQELRIAFGREYAFAARSWRLPWIKTLWRISTLKPHPQTRPMLNGQDMQSLSGRSLALPKQAEARSRQMGPETQVNDPRSCVTHMTKADQPAHE